jgi:hypothetical protein
MTSNEKLLVFAAVAVAIILGAGLVWIPQDFWNGEDEVVDVAVGGSTPEIVEVPDPPPIKQLDEKLKADLRSKLPIPEAEFKVTLQPYGNTLSPGSGTLIGVAKYTGNPESRDGAKSIDHGCGPMITDGVRWAIVCNSEIRVYRIEDGWECEGAKTTWTWLLDCGRVK